MYKFSTLLTIIALSLQLSSMPAFASQITCRYLYMSFNAESSDLYSRLGLKHNATEKEIKKAYRRAAQYFHPDKMSALADPSLVAQNEEKFKKIKEAYEILSNKTHKKNYDFENSTTFDSTGCRGFCSGYASEETLEIWGQQNWNQLVSLTPSPTKLNVSREDLNILVKWVANGNSILKENQNADPFSNHGGSGFNSIQLSNLKIVKTGMAATLVIRELGNRLDAKTLINILNTSVPGSFGSYGYVRNQAIYELLRIYKSNRNMEMIPAYFVQFINNQNEARGVDLIIRGLESIVTPASTEVLKQILANRNGWIEGSHNTYLNWTHFFKFKVSKILESRVSSESVLLTTPSKLIENQNED